MSEFDVTLAYDGIAVDPGSPKMRKSLQRHLRRIKPRITKVVATHAHEEHVGNLNWLLELDIEILIEGHEHINTLRADIPDLPGVVIREDPKIAISQKLDYMRWLREQIDAGFLERLPMRVIEASCFPWGRRTSWETCATDECIRLLSLGHFSRTELVRSFVRNDSNPLPTVYEVRMSARE